MAAWATNRVVWQLRRDVLDRQVAMPLPDLVARGAGETMVRTVNEVGVPGGDSPVFTGIAGVIGTVTSSITNIVNLASAAIAMFVLSPRLALLSLVLLPIPVRIALWWGRIIYGAIRRQYEQLGALTDFLLRTFHPRAALRDRLLGRQQSLAADFQTRHRQLTNASIYARVLFHWYDNVSRTPSGGPAGA